MVHGDAVAVAGRRVVSDTPDDADDWFARHKRELRWRALEEDGPMFGLVPEEEAELAALRREFGTADA